MKTRSVRLIIDISVVCSILTACSPSSSVMPSTVSAIPSATLALTQAMTLTPSITPSPTLTPIPTGTPTPTQIPEELRNQIIQSYGIVLFVQATLELLDETAQRVKSGELSGLDSFGALIVIAAFVNAIDEAIPEIDPPPPIDYYWEDILNIHAEVKGIIRRWFNKEINSSVVIEEVKPLIENLGSVITSIERDLAIQYNFTSEDLTKERLKIMEDIRSVFETPTSTSPP